MVIEILCTENSVKGALSFSISFFKRFTLKRQSVFINLFQCVINILLTRTIKNLNFQVNDFLVKIPFIGGDKSYFCSDLSKKYTVLSISSRNNFKVIGESVLTNNFQCILVI